MAEKWRESADGSLELVDTETGQVIERQKGQPKYSASPKRVSKPGRPSQVEIARRNGWKYDPTSKAAPRRLYEWKPEYLEALQTGIITGKSMREIAEELNLPYPVWYGFFRDREELKSELDIARKFRAAAAEMEMIAIAGQARDLNEEQVSAYRLAFDAYKHIAAVNDPERYGTKVKTIGENKPSVFIIDTGIRREPIEFKQEQQPGGETGQVIEVTSVESGDDSSGDSDPDPGGSAA